VDKYFGDKKKETMKNKWLNDVNDTEGCQMRLVPIWSPSGMTMGMVPDC